MTFRWHGVIAFAVALMLVGSMVVRAGQDRKAARLFRLDGIAFDSGMVEQVRTTPDRVVVYSLQSPQRRVAAVGVGGAEAVVYQATGQSGLFQFENLTATTGSVFAGSMLADNMGLGGGFQPGQSISSYSLDVFRSTILPQSGPADLHVELWDGDPLCMVDTPGGGFSCLPIAGSEADFVGLPSDTLVSLIAKLPVPVLAPNKRVWMVVSGSQTANPSPCRLGWRISGQKPSIGNDAPADLFENQFDGDGRVNGGTCCPDGSACNASDPICAFCGTTGAPCLANGDCPAGDTCLGGAEDGDRGLCSDGHAETPLLFSFGGPCIGDPVTDNCATFVASVLAPADVTVTLQPVGNGPNGALNPGTSIVGHEIILQKGGAKVFLELKISDFDVVDTFCVGGDNDGLACTSDADCPDTKACSITSTNPGSPCSTNADCGGPNGACESVDPGSCGQKLQAYQASIDHAGFTSALEGTLTRCPVPCTTDADCLAAFGGVCNLDKLPCRVDGDCAAIGMFMQTCTNGGPEGAKCDLASGQCIAAFVTEARPDYVFASANGTLAAVDVSTNFTTRIGALVTGNSVDEAAPFPAGGAYGGTLVLNVSTNARGTFTVSFLPQPASVLLNHQSFFIPLVALVPAQITIGTGQCCMPGTPVCMDDDRTRNECLARGGTFKANKTCNDPCPCTSNAGCNDHNACTTDVCVCPGGFCKNPGLCSNTPNFDETLFCCNPSDGTLCSFPVVPAGDFTGDGMANLSDVAVMQNCFGLTSSSAGCENVDMTCDCTISLPDHKAFVNALVGFLQRGAPSAGQAVDNSSPSYTAAQAPSTESVNDRSRPRSKVNSSMRRSRAARP